MGTAANEGPIVAYAGELWQLVLSARVALLEDEEEVIDAGRVLCRLDERREALAWLEHATDRLALLRLHAPHIEIGHAVRARNAIIPGGAPCR